MLISRLPRLFRPLVEVAVATVVILAALFVAALWFLPRTGQAQSLSVMTGSMSPSIPQGSMVLIRPVDPQQLAVGDVITFHPASNPNVLVTHRISGFVFGANSERSFRTQGDANGTEDLDPVPANAVVGRVVFHAPFVGTLSARAHTPAGLAVIIGLPLLAYAGSKLRTAQRRPSLALSGAAGNE